MDPARFEVLRDSIGEAAWHGAERLTADDPDGWIHLRVRIDWPREAPYRLLPMGGSA